MNPGELRNRVVIKKNTKIKNAFGEVADNWEVVAEVWANINPISGKEFFSADTVNSSVSHRIRIRYRKDITSDMIIDYKGRTFEINSIINEYERDKILQLMCKEVL